MIKNFLEIFFILIYLLDICISQTNNNKLKNKIMSRQEKINRLEKSGKKVQFVYPSNGDKKIIINGKNSFSSVNQAYKYYYGY